MWTLIFLALATRLSPHYVGPESQDPRVEGIFEIIYFSLLALQNKKLRPRKVIWIIQDHIQNHLWIITVWEGAFVGMWGFICCRDVYSWDRLNKENKNKKIHWNILTDKSIKRKMVIVGKEKESETTAQRGLSFHVAFGHVKGSFFSSSCCTCLLS